MLMAENLLMMRRRRRANAGGLAGVLLGSESNGLALVADDMSLAIRDTTTPANVFLGDANSKLTYSAPSTKYILNQAGIYVPDTTLRCEYDASGNPLGIRIEESSTGLFSTSRISSFVITTGNTVTPNDRADVFGGNAADLFQKTSTQSYRGISLVKAASALPYTVTAIVERNVGDYFCFTVQGTSSANRARTTFDLSTGTVSRAATSVGFTGATSGIELLPNGRALCWISFTTDASTGVSAYLSVAESNILNVDTHDTGTTASCWVSYMQIEQKAFRTSPIVTTGSTVTRAADNITLLTSAFPSSFPLTVSAIFRSSTPNNNNAVYGVFAVDNTTTANRAALYKYNAAAGYVISSGSVDQATQNIAAGLTLAGEEMRLSLRAKLNDTRPSLNGTLATLDTSATMPVGVSRSLFGQWLTGGSPLNGHLRTVLVVPRDVTDAELPTFGALS